MTETQKANSKIIRGFEDLDWGGGFFRRQVSGVTTLTAVMKAYGEDTSYDEVMGFSGIAFMTRMKRDWCPSSVCYNFDDKILSSFGYKRTRINMDREKNPDAAVEALKAVVEGIGRGIPIPYCDGEDSLIVGYKDDGNTFVCMPYSGSKDGYADMPWPRGMLGDAWWIDIIEKASEPKDRRTRIVDSLRNAVALAKEATQDAEGNPCGFAAYESWIGALENPTPELNLHGNAYCYAIMLSSRDAAAKYMRMAARELGEPSARHLLAAAEHYSAEQQRLWDGRDCVKHPWRKSWTPENRKIEADIMKANLKDERAAISEIEKAIRAEREGIAVAATKTTGGRDTPKENLMINWIPDGKSTKDWVDGYVRGLELILNRKGANTDYNTIMGDIGLAFTMQGEDMNKIEGAVDIGWWPNEPMSLIRLGFLEKTLGYEVKTIRTPPEEAELAKNKPREAFMKWYEPRIRSSIAADMPCIIGYSTSQYIVTGVDKDKHPLIGMCPNEKKGDAKIYRIEEPMPPCELLVIGKAVPRMNRADADRAALAYAIALHRERILSKTETAATAQFSLVAEDIDRYKKWNWHTGTESFNIWVRCLEDTDHVGQGRWHANAQWSLVRNRKAAVAYLHDMAKRHTGTVNLHLLNACKHYESVIAEMQKANTSNEEIKSKLGREALITIVKQVATLEGKAMSELEIALSGMK